jgi:transposase
MHLEKRVSRGKTYYCAVEKKRIDGKVKTVRQIYLGSAERITERLNEPLPKFKTYSYGDIALLLHVAELTGFRESVNAFFSNRASDYFLLLVINRLLEPTSKAGISQWYGKTCLPVVLDKRLSPSSQVYWNLLDQLTDVKRASVWDAVFEKTKSVLKITDDTFLFDITNFFTYIADHEKNVLPKKGHSKQMRNNLNLISLGMMVGENSALPYNYDLYRGNLTDCNNFPSAIEAVKNKPQAFDKEKITLVFDKGNNSPKNFEALKGYHFVGSLPKAKAEASDLVELETKPCYESTPGKPVCSVSKLARVYGLDCKIVLSYNERLYRKQTHAIDERIQRTRTKFELVRNRVFRTESSARNHMLKILPRKQNPFSFEVKKVESKYVVELNLDEEKEKLYRRWAGKNVIFSNRLDWSDERIIRAYRSLNKVEHQFKLMHGSLLVPLKPVYHWTDQKIEAHVLMCMLSLLFARVLDYECRRKGIVGDFRAVLKTARDIRLAIVQKDGRPQFVFEEMGVGSQALMEAFSLSRFVKH